MADKVGTGFVAIKPDTAGFGDDLEKGVEQEGGPAAERSGGKLAGVMKGAFLAGAALIGKSVIDFGGFEKQMNEVFTLLPGISGEAMTEMTGQVKGFASEFGVLPNEVVPALYQSLSAGVPKDNVFEFLETAQKLAKGGVTDLTTSVDGLSGVVNAYGSEVLTAEHASDLMFTTVKLGKTTIADLSGALGNVTPVAASLGVPFEQISAALATMTLTLGDTSVSTTQMRQLLVEMSKDGSAAAKTFADTAGVSFQQFMALGGNLQEALGVMSTAAKDGGVSVSDLFGSVEAGSAALILTGAGAESFTTGLAAMGDAAGATDAAYDTMNKGLSATLDKLKAKFAVSMLSIGEAIAPTVAAAGGFLVGLMDAFSALPGPMQAVVVLFATLTAGTLAFAGPILKMITLGGKLGGVFKMLAANPWVLIAAGLVLVAVLIIKNWDKVKVVLERIFEFIKFAGKEAGEFFAEVWETSIGAASAFWDSLWAKVEQVFGAITGAATALQSAIAGAFTAIVDSITGAWTTLTTITVATWDAIWAKVEAVFGAIAGAAQTLWSTITGVFDLITSSITTAWNAVTSATTTAWNTVSSIVSTIGGAVVSFITGIPNAIAGAFSTLAEAITAPFRAAFNGIKYLWNATLGGFGFTVPDWIPEFGGKQFRIPSMAAGGVLAGPQMFMGGEYPGAAGNPEIVAPQNIMRETVIEALAATGGTGGGLTVNGPLIGSATIRDDRDIVELSRELAREVERRQRGAGKRLGGVAAA